MKLIENRVPKDLMVDKLLFAGILQLLTNPY